MPSVKHAIEIAASPEAVWNILSDISYMPKIFPDIISAKAEPEGSAVVGQKIKIVGRMAKRKVEMSAEVTDVEPNQKLVVKAVPGGPVKAYVNTLTLSETKKGGTKFSASVEYELAGGYFGKLVSAALVKRTAAKNATASLKNLKDLCELKEMPAAALKT